MTNHTLPVFYSVPPKFASYKLGHGVTDGPVIC